MTTAARRLLAPGEAAPVLRAALAAFLLWTGYGILRPLRDEVASALHGETDLLWTGTFFAAVLAVPLYGRLAARATPRGTVALVYRLIAVLLLVFWGLFRTFPDGDPGRAWTDRAFYLFTSIYNLFAIGLLWSLATEAFRSEQGQRVFGLVAAGVSLGGIAGSAITAFLVRSLGAAPLLLLSAATLELALRLARTLLPAQRAARPPLPTRDPWWRGLRELFADRYLRAVSAYLLLFLVGSGVLYLTKTGMVGEAYADRDQRRAFLSRVDLSVNGAALLLQIFATGRLMPRAGVGRTLAFVPAVTLAGFALLAAAPSLALVVSVEIVRRVAEFAMSKPAREVLFTVAGRRARFQSKPLLDTVVYRGGDVLVAHGYHALAAAGAGPAGMALAVLPFAACGLLLAVRLGGMHARIAAKQDASASSGSA